MESYLRKLRDGQHFPSTQDWADWLVANAFDICLSWGDDGKPSTPLGLMLEVLAEVRDAFDPEDYGDLVDAIKDDVKLWLAESC